MALASPLDQVQEELTRDAEKRVRSDKRFREAKLVQKMSQMYTDVMYVI